MTETLPIPSGYTCGSCDSCWQGVSRCHCAGNRTVQIDFVALPAKKAAVIESKLRPGGPQFTGASAELIAALTQDQGAISFRTPRHWSPQTDPILTSRAHLSAGPFTRVSWGAVNGTFVEVEDFLVGMPTSGRAGRIVALRRKVDSGGPCSMFYLRSALPRTRGQQPVTNPEDVLRLRISAGCHRTFASERAFNLHHSDDGCLDPSSLLRASDGADGGVVSSQMLFLHNGLWGAEEHPVDRGAALRAAHAARARHIEATVNV